MSEPDKKKVKLELPSTQLRLRVTEDMEFNIARGKSLFPAVKEILRQLETEPGVSLALKNIFKGEMEIVNSETTLVGASLIRAECSSTGLFDGLRYLRARTDRLETELVKQKTESDARVDRLELEVSTHRHMLRSLALEKVTAVATEVILRAAHRRQESSSEDTDQRVRGVMIGLAKSPSVKDLLRRNGISRDLFVANALSMRTRRNLTAHFVTDFDQQLQRAVSDYVPILVGVTEADFAVFIVNNADTILP